MRCDGVGWRWWWMSGTHLQGPHQSVCWLRPKRARHFLGEPGSEHNAQHAQYRKGRRGKKEAKNKRGAEEEEGETRLEGEDRRRRRLIRAGESTKSVQRKPSSKTVSRRLRPDATSTTSRITTRHRQVSRVKTHRGRSSRAVTLC